MSAIRYTKISYRNYQLKPTRIVGKSFCMILTKKQSAVLQDVKNCDRFELRFQVEIYLMQISLAKYQNLVLSRKKIPQW